MGDTIDPVVAREWLMGMVTGTMSPATRLLYEEHNALVRAYLDLARKAVPMLLVTSEPIGEMVRRVFIAHGQRYGSLHHDSVGLVDTLTKEFVAMWNTAQAPKP